MKVFIANFGRENYEWPTCLLEVDGRDDELHWYWIRQIAIQTAFLSSTL